MARPPTNRVQTKAESIDGQTIHNQILLRLPKKECSRLFAELDFVTLPTSFVLNEARSPIPFAYFVNAGLASVLSVMEDGKSVEVGLMGSEGFVGLPLVAGFDSSSTQVIMQVAGSGFRVSSKNLLVALKDCPVLAKRLERFGQELGIQAAQVAACNRLHGTEERLARWLLMSQDRLGGDIVGLTQEFLSHMLGTRRASVTVAAGILQKAGLISLTRGVVRIDDRAGLEKASCECYAAIAKQVKTWKAEAR